MKLEQGSACWYKKMIATSASLLWANNVLQALDKIRMGRWEPTLPNGVTWTVPMASRKPLKLVLDMRADRQTNCIHGGFCRIVFLH